MDSIHQRIKLRRAELQLSQAELAKRLGYKSRSSIQKIETGENDIPQAKIEAFAKALSTTPAYLMGLEDGPAIAGAKRIPILGRIAAGLPLYAEQQIEGYTYVDVPDDGEYFGLIVQGDSMDAAGLKDGYTLILRREAQVENGAIAAVLVNGQDATVKRFYRSGGQVTLMPQSTNPIHQPQTYAFGEADIQVQGRVVKVAFNL